MTAFPFQHYLDRDPQSVADAGGTLYAGPTALMAGLPADRSARSLWRPHDNNNTVPLIQQAKQGKGALLLYRADQALMLRLAVEVKVHSGRVEAEAPSSLWTFTHLKRGYYGIKSALAGRHVTGPKDGFTVALPRLYYELVPQVNAADGGLLSTNHVLYHGLTQAAGTFDSAYLLMTEDAFGQAQADVASEAELATATPEQLTTSDPQRPLVWLKLPLGTLPEAVVRLSETSVSEAARLVAAQNLTFAMDLLPPGRESAALDALREQLRASPLLGFDHVSGEKLSHYQYYMDLNAVYGSVNTSLLDQGVITANRPASIQSMFSFPSSGQFYFEADMPTTGNLYTTVSFGTLEQDYGNYSSNSPNYCGYYNYAHQSYPYGTNTVRFLVDMDARRVTYLMDDVDVGAGYGTAGVLQADTVYYLLAGITNAGSGAGQMRLRFTDEDFLFAKPAGYQAVATLLPAASNV